MGERGGEEGKRERRGEWRGRGSGEGEGSGGEEGVERERVVEGRSCDDSCVILVEPTPNPSSRNR